MMLALLSREVGRPFHVMASWHLFMQSRLQSFLLPRIGAFIVYREGLDREALKCATRILAEAQSPLTIFPEGFITRNNDRLFNLMDGVPFLARSAAKQRAATPLPGKVVLHPVFIRYLFEGDLATTLAPVLQKIEARLAMLGAIEAAHYGPLWLAIAVAVIALGEMLIVLVLRAHYTMDVVSGGFAAFLAAEVGGKLTPVVDAWLR